MFGGPSGGEIAASNQQKSMADTMWGNFQQNYGNQQDALQRFQGELGLISGGNTGLGWGPAETSAVNAQIANSTGAASRNAIQAAEDRSAGQVFNGAQNDNGLRSGIREQLEQQAQAGAETAGANAQTAALVQNINQGRTNAIQTASGLNTLAGNYGHIADVNSGGAQNENAQYFNTQKTISQQRQQEFGNILGAVTGVATSFLPGGGIAKLIKGGMSALSGGGNVRDTSIPMSGSPEEMAAFANANPPVGYTGDIGF
jgi:hypothetical protein